MQNKTTRDASRTGSAKPALEDLYGSIGIPAVAAAVRYQTTPAVASGSAQVAERFFEAA
jgi:hypothetical protein